MVELEFLVGVGDWGRGIYTRYEFPFFLFLSFFFFPSFDIQWFGNQKLIMSCRYYYTLLVVLSLSFFLSFIRVNTMVDLYEKKKNPKLL